MNMLPYQTIYFIASVIWCTFIPSSLWKCLFPKPSREIPAILWTMIVECKMADIVNSFQYHMIYTIWMEFFFYQ